MSLKAALETPLASVACSPVVRFWQVDFYPMEAHTAVIEAHPRWVLTPVKRLAKCGTAVTRAYSQALRTGPPVEAKTSWGRFVFTPDAPPFAPSRVPALGSLGMGEIHEVQPPPLSLLDAPDYDRRLGLLTFLHEHLLRLAAALDWYTQPFEQARLAVLASDLRYVLRSPMKASPDRRHRAGVTMEVDGNGDAWLELAVLTQAGDVVHTSPPLMTHESERGFNAVRRTIHWSSRTTVTVDAWPLDDPFGPEGGGKYMAEVRGDVS
ncbi:hypothetical protein [Geodermatophilus ruber]|uniref:Uncharacterized protein n=1 Tax=Geodermatophilus ruber TaxID=504800 RepID=A0A1I4JY65_9ACTN|nr:hypothetical protein [Geodermatophilus ruber]SFL71519.1 hypothetical protein SAMN04488085_11618 [Geodermatophilus ruber]